MQPRMPDAGTSSSTGAGVGVGVDASGDAGNDVLPAVVVATSCFELVGPQPHLAESLAQEPFVLVSRQRYDTLHTLTCDPASSWMAPLRVGLGLTD